MMTMNDYVALIEARQHQSEAVEFVRKERLVQIAREALMERLQARRNEPRKDEDKK